MKYYLWVDAEDRPVGLAWAYADEIERMVEELRPPKGAVFMRAGTREELEARYGLKGEDFVAGE